MAFDFISSLKALAPVAASAGGLGGWLANRLKGKSPATEQRIAELESGLQEQARAVLQLAERARVLSEKLEEKEKEISCLRKVAWFSVALAAVALALALLR